MNGQLSEHPLAELIQEISAKSLSGKLQVQHERVRAVFYFDKGELLYAASNVRTFRLREYLLKAGVSEVALSRYDERRSDIELTKSLCADQVLSAAAAEQLQSRQVSDVLRLALLWTEGSWEFDIRARLTEAPQIKIDAASLLVETGRRLPAKFVGARFESPAELISPVVNALNSQSLLPTEVFLLSRLDRPTPLRELIAVSGLGESETLVLIYSLALGGLLQRENWKRAFRSTSERPAPAKPAAVSVPAEEPPADDKKDQVDNLETFLQTISTARSYYDVLGVATTASPVEMKTRYYEIARRYHPDRFRKSESSLLSRIESAFARVTQAYDTLRDDGLRSTYDAKLRARQKVQQVIDAAPKPVVADAPPETTAADVNDPGISLAERAALQFKEGLEALELGQRKVALGLFASAARAAPNQPRYRGLYGQLLAENPNTLRAAEGELQAAIKLDPKNGEYRVKLAELYRDLGLPLRAKGEAERAIAADPNNRKARDLLRALKSV